jgi:hypothetical protein
MGAFAAHKGVVGAINGLFAADKGSFETDMGVFARDIGLSGAIMGVLGANMGLSSAITGLFGGDKGLSGVMMGMFGADMGLCSAIMGMVGADLGLSGAIMDMFIANKGLFGANMGLLGQINGCGALNEHRWPGNHPCGVDAEGRNRHAMPASNLATKDAPRHDHDRSPNTGFPSHRMNDQATGWCIAGRTREPCGCHADARRNVHQTAADIRRGSHAICNEPKSVIHTEGTGKDKQQAGRHKSESMTNRYDHSMPAIPPP